MSRNKYDRPSIRWLHRIETIARKTNGIIGRDDLHRHAAMFCRDRRQLLHQPYHFGGCRLSQTAQQQLTAIQNNVNRSPIGSRVINPDLIRRQRYRVFDLLAHWRRLRTPPFPLFPCFLFPFYLISSPTVSSLQTVSARAMEHRDRVDSHKLRYACACDGDQ